jgi:hypothetical protein
MKIILDTMELVEVGDVVYERSKDMLTKTAPKFIHKQKEYARVMQRRGNVKTYFKPITIVDNEITYYIIPSCLGKNDLKKYGIRGMVACEFRYQGEKFYGLCLNNLNQISLYTTHFIKRYIERHLKDDSLANAETFIKFLMETDGISNGFDECDDNKVQWQTSIGNTCGCMLSERVLLHKTFIDSTTIIKGKKKDANARGNELMKYFRLNNVGVRTLPKELERYYNFNLV